MYTTPKVNHYKLIDYFDVWGNKVDGWEINNLCTVKEDIIIAEDSTDEEIIYFLISIGYFKESARDVVYIECSEGDIIEFFEKETDKPICVLERKI